MTAWQFLLDRFFPWPVAGHVAGQRPAGPLSWLAALALGAGIFFALTSSRRRVRQLAVVLAVAGLVGTIDDMIVRSQRPPRPDLVLRLVSPPSRTTDPLVVRACGMTRSGRPVPITAGGRYLLVYVDGVLSAEVHDSIVILPVSRGWHRLTVEVTSRYHQEFQPPLKRELRVDVAGTGNAPIPHC